MNAPSDHGPELLVATAAALPPLAAPPGVFTPQSGGASQSGGAPRSGGAPQDGRRIDRAARRRSDQEWLDRAWKRARILVIDQDRVLVHGDPARLLLLGADVAPDGERYFLGVDADVDATPYFAVTGPIAVVEEAAADDIRPVAPRDVVHLLGRPDAELLMTAIALMNWHGRHGYSPATGHPTTAGDAGWTRAASDGETIWPRTDPAVIVLVHDGVAGAPGRCLLGHNAGWTAPGWNRRYSCLAGFVEPGEPAEASVCREVEEEVGVAVSGIRYVSSQAWPFPGSLMLGFLATADPAQPIRVDPTEISDARWFSRSEVTAILAGEPTDVRLPAPVSIAYYLLRWWLDER